MATLKEIRADHFITQRELADLAGVSESSIIRMEEPGHLTRKDVVEKVLAALSKKTGEQFTLENVEGLSIYNVMRNRRSTRKSKPAQTSDAA